MGGHTAHAMARDRRRSSVSKSGSVTEAGERQRYVVDSVEIESHDLEPLHNTVLRDDKIHRIKDRKCYGYSGATLSKNIITVLIGLLTAIVAYAISVVVVRPQALFRLPSRLSAA